jgi:hypothetical protein
LQFVNTENIDFVHSGTWCAPLNWSAAPWLEFLIGQSLTEWQKTVAEYMLARQLPKWGDAWRTSVISAGVAAALLVLPHFSFTTFGATLAIAYSLGAAVPLAMSLVMGKINLLRFAAWVPVGLFLGAVIGWRDSDGPLAGTVFTVRIFLLWIAALPIFAAGHFSKRTNDTTNLRLVTLPIFLFFGVVFGVLLVGVGIFGLAAPLPLALAAPPAMALIALAGWALYRRFYERGRVDLLSTRPR